MFMAPIVSSRRPFIPEPGAPAETARDSSPNGSNDELHRGATLAANIYQKEDGYLHQPIARSPPARARTLDCLESELSGID